MKQAELTGVSRRRLLAMGSASAGATLLAGRPAFARANIQKTSFDSVK
jgi:hypothetical protein